MIELPVTDNPRQEFSVILEGRRVTMELWYAVFLDRWSMSLAIDGDPVLAGIRVVTGVDLLARFSLGVGIIFAWSPSAALPGRNELPQGTVKLFCTTQEEVDAAVAS